MFHLDTSIAAWRRLLESNPSLSEDDVAELVQHLRDQVAAFIAEDLAEKEAFERALTLMGDYSSTETEYRKIYWAKRRRRRELTSELIPRLSMLENYLKLAWRNVLRQKGYSLINVAGLTLGLACSFFILLWVTDEISYDRFHEDGDQIYQVWRHFTTEGQINTANSLSKPVAETLEAEYPEVQEAVITGYTRQSILTIDDRSYREIGRHVDPDFFRVFSFPFLSGNQETALLGTASAVITDRTARKLFGADWQTRGDVIGRSITIDHRKDFTITGVVRDVPENSTIQFDVLLPIQEHFARDERFGHWWFMDYLIYVKLRQDASLEAFNTKIADHFSKHDEGTETQIFLQRFEDVYLHSIYKDGRLVGGRIQYVRIFSAIAVFLLLIASVNFMNLATARASQRAREIGVRKAIGARQQSLITQFMAESLAMVFAAFLLALGLVVGLLPAFNGLTGKQLTGADLNGTFLLAMLGLSLIVGIASGSYPALYLSSFNPVAILRGTFRQRSGTVNVRKGLVVFQFALSVVLIVSTLAVYRQLEYIRTTNLGLDRENLLYIPREGALAGRYEAVAQELRMQPGIVSVTASGHNPLTAGSNTTNVNWPGKAPDHSPLFHTISVSYDFVETMKMELAQGRDFSRAFGADSANYLINETAAEVIGGQVIDQALELWEEPGKIVGVVKDFSMNSLYSPIQPTIIRLEPDEAHFVFIRTQAGRTQEGLASVKAVYERFNPDYPFEYTFVDQEFERTYRSEAVMGTLANVFAVVALLISCLGLSGLTSFTIEQRTKEVGVRKVLGASVTRLVTLLTSGFTKLVLAGVVVAAPVAFYAVNSWLDNFENHITLGVETFVLAGVAALLVAWITAGFQSVRAALADPVKTLRYE